MSPAKTIFSHLLIPVVDAAIVIVSVFVAYLLRFNFAIPDSEMVELPLVLGTILIVRTLLFVAIRAYIGVIRYTGVTDLFRFILVLILGSFIFILADFITYYLINQRLFIPLTIIILEFIITTLLLLFFRSMINGGTASLIKPKSIAVDVKGSAQTGGPARRNETPEEFTPHLAEAIRERISARTILITGAASAVTPGLLRLLFPFNPAAIILADPSGWALDSLYSRFHKPSATRLACELVDHTDAPGLEAIFQKHRPEVLFHLLPPMHDAILTSNPREGFRSTVAATQLLLQVASRSTTAHGMLVSYLPTAKPATMQHRMHRMAERLLLKYSGTDQAANQNSPACFAVLRIDGHVAGDANVEPFARLLLEATASAANGEIFEALQERPPEKISQARQMILGSGLRVTGDGDETGMDATVEPLTRKTWPDNQYVMAGKMTTWRLHKTGPAKETGLPDLALVEHLCHNYSTIASHELLEELL